jgi:hypothetical protein
MPSPLMAVTKSFSTVKVDAAGQIGLERQVHVAHVHHDPAVHAVLAGEGQAQAAGPMRHRAGRGAEPRRAAAGRAAQVDVRSVPAADVTRISCRFAQHLDANLHLGVQVRPSAQSAPGFRVFVGDDQQPRAAGVLDLGPFRGVDHAFDRAVDDHLDAASAPRPRRGCPGSPRRCRWTSPAPGPSAAGSASGSCRTRPPGHRRPVRKMHQHRARLGFRHDRHFRALADAVQRKDPPEGGQPFPLDPFLQHPCGRRLQLGEIH